MFSGLLRACLPAWQQAQGVGVDRQQLGTVAQQSSWEGHQQPHGQLWLAPVPWHMGWQDDPPQHLLHCAWEVVGLLAPAG